MKSIERKFNEIKIKNPLWSSMICFSESIKYKKLGKGSVRTWFTKLVERDNYINSEKNEILKDLYIFSNKPRNSKLSPKQSRNTS